MLRPTTSADAVVWETGVETGLTNKQIGATLYCSPYTVDSHPRAIYRKLAVANRAALASHVSRANEAAQPGAERSAPVWV